MVAVGEAGEPGPDFLSLAGLLPLVVHCLPEVSNTYLAGEELVVAVGEAGEPGPDFLSLAGLLPLVVHCLPEV